VGASALPRWSIGSVIFVILQNPQTEVWGTCLHKIAHPFLVFKCKTVFMIQFCGPAFTTFPDAMQLLRYPPELPNRGLEYVPAYNSSSFFGFQMYDCFHDTILRARIYSISQMPCSCYVIRHGNVTGRVQDFLN
jgi:hypothetical protein